MSPETWFSRAQRQQRKEMPTSTASEFKEELSQSHEKMVGGAGSI